MNKIHIKEDLVQQLYQIRKQLHQYPELSFKEYETANIICMNLDKWNIPFKRMGETGVIADIVGEKAKGGCIGIRADIDALPIQENTGLTYASKKPGVMHACGHDGHTTILLGATYVLHQLKSELTGTVRCIFQPGEEEDGAAKQMIKEGVLENPNVEAMLALHLWPHLTFGSVGIKYGCVTAGYDDFIIEIIGKSGHGGRPHYGLDAIAIGAQVIQSLQFLVTKLNNPTDPIVINIGKISGGTASNVIPEKVVLEGTIRTTSPLVRQQVLSQFSHIVNSIPRIYGGCANIKLVGENPPIINNDNVTSILQQTAEEILGQDKLYLLKSPSMGADDFGAFAEKVPSCYFRLGIRKENKTYFDLHHPKFHFDHDVIPIGVELFVKAVLNWFNKKGDFG